MPAGYQPLPLKAGPSRLGAGPGTGPSFLRDPQRASTGLEDGSKYIHRGPDGKGGSVSVFKAAAAAAAATQPKVGCLALAWPGLTLLIMGGRYWDQ